ncbi:MAG: PBP1A family penicillin-binding protein [Desulfovibrionaceae bacterium]|nr:PBP1A family penicillin-binding protein [Desulfovibrionaceae bacterium]
MKIRFRRVLLACLILGLVLTAVGSAIGAAIYMWAAQDLPNIQRISDYKPPLVTTVYARDGSIMGYFYSQRRFLVAIDEVPEHVRLAFLAAEDDNFYSHQGVDPIAMFRAFIRNLEAGKIKEGASTITQQLVKALLLDEKKEYERKLKEMILAYRLEKYLTKDEILTIYLNHIYLGNGAYGVEAAARTYFGKHIGELTIAEAAVIAGLPKAPSSLNPYNNPDRSRERQEYVLGRMHTLGWISNDEYQTALAQQLNLQSMEEPGLKVGAWYLEEVRRELEAYMSEDNLRREGINLDRYGEDAVRESGLHVFTAMDPVHQKAAEAAVRQNLIDYTHRQGWKGPVETLEPEQLAAFLSENQPSEEFFSKTAWAKAVVTSVEKEGAAVRLGSIAGHIPLKNMKWAAPSGNAAKTLNENDVVWVSLAGEQAPAGIEEVAPDQALELALEQIPEAQSALVSIEVDSGDVVALVGGYEFNYHNQFNRAVQARRQPGSSFKPIVYSAAIDNGLTAGTVVYDTPVVHVDPGSGKVWIPKNYDGKFSGPILLATALRRSKNACTVRIAQQIGVPAIIDRAYALGIDAKFQSVMSISLGVTEVTPLNLTQAYIPFARGGTAVEPRFITAIKNAWGEDVAVFPPQVREAISPQNAYIMSQLLEGVVQAGTGARARELGKPMGGKTGTSNDEHDAWFIGFTPHLATGVFVGYDTPKKLGRGETGGRTALPAFVMYREKVEQLYPADPFPVPEGIVMASTGGLTLPFVEGSQPGSGGFITGLGAPVANDNTDDLKELF